MMLLEVIVRSVVGLSVVVLRLAESLDGGREDDEGGIDKIKGVETRTMCGTRGTEISHESSDMSVG